MKSSLLLILEMFLLVAGIGIYALGIFPFPILPLFLMAWASLHLRHLRWRDVGLRRPARILPIVGQALLIGSAYQALDIFLIAPFLQRLTGEAIDLTLLSGLRGNLLYLIIFLVISWTEAAFIEEMFFRGYLINRLTDLFGRDRRGIIIALFCSALVFGVAHAYQGITGVVDTAMAGLLLGFLYWAGKRNLWLPILIHGVIDTIGILLIFTGYVG